MSAADDARSPRVRPADVLEAGLGRIGSFAVLRVKGEIDALTSELFESAVAAAMDEPDATSVIVDLSEVTFLSPAGLTVLAESAHLCDCRGLALRVVVDHSRPVVRPLEMTDMDTELRLYHTLREAIAG